MQIKETRRTVARLNTEIRKRELQAKYLRTWKIEI
jgi:ribosomal protein L29